jgi:bacterioferritin
MDKQVNLELLKEIEDRVDEFIESLPCKSDAPMPEVKVEEKNEKYAQLLYSALANPEISEMSAISQYIYHHHTISNKTVSNALLCISMVEMMHLDTLAEVINLLGSKPFYYNTNKHFWNAGALGYGDSIDSFNDDEYRKQDLGSEKENMRLKLEKDIMDEANAINSYIFLHNQIKDKHIRRIIEKIIEDEKFHIKIFEALITKYCMK